MKVLKFGGTSVQSAKSMLQVLNCIQSVEGKKVVLLSAVSGVTDKLLEATKLSQSNIDNSNQIIEALRVKHLEILQELIPQNNDETVEIVNKIFDDILVKFSAFEALGELTLQNIDSVQSFGELLSTNVFVAFLKSQSIRSCFLDIRDILKTDSNYTKANIDSELTHQKFEEKIDFFKNEELIVTQGFIASDSRNRTTTFGRGGSDYSASLVGSFLKSVDISIDEIQIWTDVNGVLSADPRIIPTAKTIKSLSPEEVRTLSYLGAKVLHPDTIKPALASQITVTVLNTFEPKSSGTVIQEGIQPVNNGIHSLVVIGMVHNLELKSYPDYNVWDDANKINALAEKGQCQPLYLSLTDNNLTLFFKNNPELFSDSNLSEKINISQCFMIAVTGSDMFDNVQTISDNIGTDMKIAGISKNAIFIVSKNEIKNDSIIGLHNKIIDLSYRIQYNK